MLVKFVHNVDIKSEFELKNQILPAIGEMVNIRDRHPGGNRTYKVVSRELHYGNGERFSSDMVIFHLEECK